MVNVRGRGVQQIKIKGSTQALVHMIVRELSTTHRHTKDPSLHSGLSLDAKGIKSAELYTKRKRIP